MEVEMSESTYSVSVRIIEWSFRALLSLRASYRRRRSPERNLVPNLLLRSTVAATIGILILNYNRVT